MNGTSYGYKNTAGTFVAFRKPTGTATAAQVLSGYSFSNASSDGLSGNIPIRPAGTYATLTGRNDVASFAYIPYGYYENASATYGQYVYFTDAQVNAMGGTHTAAYIYPANSTGGTIDLGVNHSYRYVNAENVYAKGKADGDVKHTVYVYAKASSSGDNDYLSEAYVMVDGVIQAYFYGNKTGSATLTV